MLEKANALALVAEGRASEVLQFAQAELLGSGVYELSGLLRGQAGTEAEVAQSWPAGTRAVLLDAALVPLTSDLSPLGRNVLYRIGRADRDHGDAQVLEISTTVPDTALRPYAPVHLAGTRTSAGIAISWVRRTRFDGDGWAGVEVPLGEGAEHYRVEILSGEAVLRTVETPETDFLYPTADELLDFGTPQARITVRITQLSALIGAGRPAVATLSV